MKRSEALEALQDQIGSFGFSKGLFDGIFINQESLAKVALDCVEKMGMLPPETKERVGNGYMIVNKWDDEK